MGGQDCAPLEGSGSGLGFPRRLGLASCGTGRHVCEAERPPGRGPRTEPGLSSQWPCPASPAAGFTSCVTLSGFQFSSL